MCVINRLTCERISWARNSKSRLRVPAVGDDEVGNLLKEVLAQIIAVYELLSSLPWVLALVVRQLQRRFTILYVHTEHIVVLLKHTPILQSRHGVTNWYYLLVIYTGDSIKVIAHKEQFTRNLKIVWTIQNL